MTSPGREEYIFTVFVGRHRRSPVQYFKEEDRHLMGKIPYIQDMVDKFKQIGYRVARTRRALGC